MKKPIFFNQKENITLIALLGLIILSFVFMYAQYSSTKTQSTSITKIKVKTITPKKIEIPHFLPAL